MFPFYNLITLGENSTATVGFISSRGDYINFFNIWVLPTLKSPIIIIFNIS